MDQKRESDLMGRMMYGAETTEEDEAIYGDHAAAIDKAVKDLERGLGYRTACEYLAWRVARKERYGDD